MKGCDLVINRTFDILKSSSITAFRCGDELRSIKILLIGSELACGKKITGLRDESEYRNGKLDCFEMSDLVLISGDEEFRFDSLEVQETQDVKKMIFVYKSLKNIINELKNIRIIETITLQKLI